MSTSPTSTGRSSPPAGEELHLPGPSILPFLCAAGITMSVIGTTISLVFLIPGLILFIVTTVLWIRDTRRDVDALPEEHQH